MNDIKTHTFEVGDKRLTSVGAGPCILLAAFNTGSHTGMVGHFSAVGENDPGIGCDKDVFEEALATIPDLGPNREHTHGWIGGGAPFFVDGDDTVKPDRLYVAQRVLAVIQDNGLIANQFTFDWSHPDRVVDASLDCESGHLRINNYENRVSEFLEMLKASWQGQKPNDNNS